MQSTDRAELETRRVQSAAAPDVSRCGSSRPERSLPESPWTRRQVVEFLESEDLSDQRIELPYGLATPGVSLDETCRKIFSGDLAGKTVLVVGCNLGYFCFEALKVGAARAVGVDINPERVRQARRLADCLGLPAEFYTMDAEQELPSGVFDVVVCVNVLHRQKDPIRLLDRLISATREKLILEVPDVDSGSAAVFLKERRFRWWQVRLLHLSRLPVILVGRNGTSSKYREPKFFLSRPAMYSLLAHHRKYFGRIDITESECAGCYLVIAKRRRVNRLLLVAGPSASGKSTFIRKLQQGKFPVLATELGLGDISRWKFTSSNQLQHLPEGTIDQLVLHYDFLRAWRKDAKIFERDEALQLLGSANEITCVTMWANTEILHQRVQARIAGLSQEPARAVWHRVRSLLNRVGHGDFPDLSGQRIRTFLLGVKETLLGREEDSDSVDIHLQVQKRVERFYSRPAHVHRLYGRWFEFCERSRPRTHWVVETLEAWPKFYPAPATREMREP